MASELKLANFFLGLSTRDQSLTWSTTSSSSEEEEEEEREEELSLCLSLGGIYSGPAQDKPSLLRSSSSSLAAGDRLRGGSVSRSCSLPNAANNRRRRRRSPQSEVAAIKNQNNCLKAEGQSDPRASPVEPRGGTGRPVGPGPHGDGGQKRVRRGGGEVSKRWAEVTRKMPSVTTTGDGPHGKRIQGFLYKYTKSHVSIVCVCHGSFLTPAEFVRHAGGTQVENPMRRINVLTL